MLSPSRLDAAFTRSPTEVGSRSLPGVCSFLHGLEVALETVDTVPVYDSLGHVWIFFLDFLGLAGALAVEDSV